MKSSLVACMLLLVVSISGCDRAPAPAVTTGHASVCQAGNGGLRLPPGFCAAVIADHLGFARHLAVGDREQVFVALRNRRLNQGGLVLLTDTDNDGFLEDVTWLDSRPGMGIGIDDGFLYFATDTEILRYSLVHGRLQPGQAAETLVSGFPRQPRHGGKPFAFDGHGYIYVNVGAPGNACQRRDGESGSPGLSPCPQLEHAAGIWRFRLAETGQTFGRHGERYASGIRNAYAIDWHTASDALYVVQHGRDGLHALWPQRFSINDGAELPAEEFFQVAPGSVHGWPYCFYDPVRGQRLLAPEYGGDGQAEGHCGEFPRPLIAFPAHYGPNDLVFYEGSRFPARYRNGAFIAFHGSYNRGPYVQVGFQVVFVPYGTTGFSNTWEVFADGFVGSGEVHRPTDAEYRPTGLAVGPSGALYVSDSVQGRIWRISYVGD